MLGVPGVPGVLVYLVQTASSSAAGVWDTGHRGSSPRPGCSRVCRLSRNCRQDSPETLPCSIQAGRIHRPTLCTHFLPVSAVVEEKKSTTTNNKQRNQEVWGECHLIAQFIIGLCISHHWLNLLASALLNQGCDQKFNKKTQNVFFF